MNKTNSSDIATSITLCLFIGVPVIFCGWLLLESAIESNVYFLPCVLFLMLSTIWVMIINAIAPILAIFTIMLEFLWWLGKKIWFAIQRRHNPA